MRWPVYRSTRHYVAEECHGTAVPVARERLSDLADAVRAATPAAEPLAWEWGPIPPAPVPALDPEEGERPLDGREREALRLAAMLHDARDAG